MAVGKGVLGAAVKSRQMVPFDLVATTCTLEECDLDAGLRAWGAGMYACMHVCMCMLMCVVPFDLVATTCTLEECDFGWCWYVCVYACMCM